MSYETDIRDKIITALQDGNTIDGLVFGKGVKDQQKKFSPTNDKGHVFVRYIGGSCELFRPQQMENHVFKNAGQNQVARFEIWIAYQKFKDEDEIEDIVSLILTILSNNKLSEVIQGLHCVQNQDSEVLEGVLWKKLIFETRWHFTGAI